MACQSGEFCIWRLSLYSSSLQTQIMLTVSSIVGSDQLTLARFGALRRDLARWSGGAFWRGRALLFSTYLI